MFILILTHFYIDSVWTSGGKTVQVQVGFFLDELRQLTFCFAVDSYVQTLGKPELLDLVARSDAMDVDGVEDLRPNKKAVVYGEVHLCHFQKFLLRRHCLRRYMTHPWLQFFFGVSSNLLHADN